MGLYKRYVFPRVINVVMNTGNMKKARVATLTDVSGEVFEIGFGTGMNLPFYPERVKAITTADVNPGMNAAARKRIAESSIEVDNHVLDGEHLPMEDERFDSVVCTWTLCSIPNAGKALGEMKRILKPGGRLYFVEHGLADNPKIQKWQHRMNPIQKTLADGCHLNRDARQLIESAEFDIVHLENYYMKKTPKFMGYTYQGVAQKA